MGDAGRASGASAGGRRSTPLLLADDRRRWRFQAVADAASVFVAVVAATVLRFEFDPSRGELRNAVLFGLLAAAVALAGGAIRGLYAGHWTFGSFEEMSALVQTLAAATVVLVGADLVMGRPVPVSVPIIAGPLTLTLCAGVRSVWRYYRERRLRPSHPGAARTVVIGAGEGGRQIITAMLRSPKGRFLPVALVDDDQAKRNLRVLGVPVRGRLDDLIAVAREHEATVALLAMPSAGSDLVRQVEERARRGGLKLRVLPATEELTGPSVDTSDIRQVTPSDLLGRHEIDTDLESIAGYLTGRRVLVTGAGGSIGSELCRQIYRYAPSRLVMLDRDESALHAVQLSIEGRAMLDSRDLVVADIRDRKRLEQVFAEHEPQVVFHAAALKHLPLLEMHPSEAVKTNVWGTASLLEASVGSSVERFVNISTDKAADPVSVLGTTKRIAERLTAHAARQDDGVYLSVRFGNVLGSRGSVLTAFTAQIQAGGPVTVTDPDVTRYFMTVEEAVQLVVQAGAVGRDGEALILDMGEPVRIDDVARRLIAEADRPVEIVYTGLRDGEKLHEILIAADEVDERPIHPRITHVQVPPLEPELAPGWSDGDDGLAERLAWTCRVDIDDPDDAVQPETDDVEVDRVEQART